MNKNEERYRNIFEKATVAMWEEDFSEVKAELDKLREEGVTDFRSYINEHPEFLKRSVQLIKILDANQAMLRLYEVKDKSEILGSLDRLITPEIFREELIAFAEGTSLYEREIHTKTLGNNQLSLLTTVTYHTDTAGKQIALVNETDITAQKKAEDYLRSQNEYLDLLNDITRVILLSTDYELTLNDLAIDLKKIINADDCYILYWNEEKQVPIPMATTAKLDFNFPDTEFKEGDEFISNRIFLTGQALTVDDIQNSPYVSQKIADLYPFRSVMGIPLIAGSQKLGIVIIAFNTLHKFTPQEIERAEQAGNQVALALWNFQQSSELEHSLKESDALARIGRALSETERVGTDRVLQLIVDSARELIEQVDESVIHIMDLEEQTLVPKAISGFDPGKKADERSKMHVGEGVAGKVIKTGETIKIGDITRSELFVKKDSPSTFLSLLVAPIRSAGREIGTISVQSKKINAFSQRDVDLLNALSVQATIAIENTRLFEATQQSLKEVNALYRVSQGLASSLDSDELIDDVVNLLHENFGYYHVQIYLIDPSGDYLDIKSGSGEIGKKLIEQNFRVGVGTGIAGHVAEIQTPFVTNNVQAVVFHYPNTLLPHTQSELAVPIKVDGNVVGVIDIQDKHPNKLTDNDLQLVGAVADQLSEALQKAELYNNLQSALQQEQTVRSQLIQSERLALVGRLLASVSHELNNPLQAIQNALFLLKDEEQFSAQGKQDLDVILAEAERMASLIKRLRSAYRPGRARDFHPVDLNNLIEDVQTLMATHLRQTQITFEFHPDPDLPAIPGMSDQIRQVVLNLFINATEVMKPQGRLTVRTQNLPLQKEVLLAVKDTGPGIDATMLPQIFDAFITDKQTGTGLGLTITRDIIEQHFGRIQAENDPQGGAIFNIWLPIDKKGSE